MSIGFQRSARPAPVSDRAAASCLRCLFLLGLACLLALAAGCTAEDGFRRYGGAVGPELHSSATIRNTPLLATYTAHLCVQAGLGDCSRELRQRDLATFVQMGLYDIDQRCDAFLDSFYYKERMREPILSQISDTRSITGSILEATKSTHAAIRIVALAFDLVESTYRNTNSALLDALDPTTVKTLVYGNQRKLKAEIAKLNGVNSLPEAYHILRAYLRVCMPHAIEMEANAILTTGQRTDGTGGASPLVQDALRFRTELRSEPETRADTGSGRREEVTRTDNDKSALEENTSPGVHREFARAICAPGVTNATVDFGPEGSSIRQAIRLWEAGLTSFLQSDVSVNGIMDTNTEDRYMRSLITSQNRYRCNASNSLIKNAYEAGALASADARDWWQKRILGYLADIEDEQFGGDCGARQAVRDFERHLSQNGNVGTFGPSSRQALRVAKTCLLASGDPIQISRTDELEHALHQAMQ